MVKVINQTDMSAPSLLRLYATELNTLNKALVTRIEFGGMQMSVYSPEGLILHVDDRSRAEKLWDDENSLPIGAMNQPLNVIEVELLVTLII